MVHWSKNPEMRKIVMDKINKTQFKKGTLSSPHPFEVGHIPVRIKRNNLYYWFERMYDVPVFNLKQKEDKLGCSII